MIIDIHCADGGDRNCWEMVSAELPFSGNCDVDYEMIVDKNAFGKDREIVKSIIIIPENADDWIDRNRNLLDQFDIESIQNNGFYEIMHDDLPHVVCPACGSDQDYDEEGNNISAI